MSGILRKCLGPLWVPLYVLLPASKISGASILFILAGIVRILNVIIFRLTRSYRGLLAAVMYTPAHIIYLRHIKKMSEFHCMSSFRLQRYPSRRTGTGQTLPVGTVFRCTEGNRWDIRQLPEPAGWFYRTTNSYHSWHRRTRIR